MPHITAGLEARVVAKLETGAAIQTPSLSLVKPTCKVFCGIRRLKQHIVSAMLRDCQTRHAWN